MILALDFGNTCAKGAYFENGDLLKALQIDSYEELQGELSQNEVSSIWYASVRKTTDWLTDLNIPVYKLTHLSNIPITNNYQSPETLGMDRLAAVVGVQATYPDSDCLVIDMGTCITFDFIDKNRTYEGGAISPGVEMRLKALHNFTGALPLVDKAENWNHMGVDTNSCILAGVFQGVLNEINGHIDHFEALYPNLKVVLTGGDSALFESKIKGSIFVHSNLVLEGLNRIFIHGEASK